MFVILLKNKKNATFTNLYYKAWFPTKQEAHKNNQKSACQTTNIKVTWPQIPKIELQ